MPIAGVETNISGLGYYGGFTYNALTLTDWPCVSASAELKTEYRFLSNAAYTVGIGASLQGYHHVILGGFVGGPEGAAAMRVACELLLIPLYKSKAVGSTCIDIRYMSDCGRESVWANSVAAQAVSRNTHLIVVGQDNPVSGPCTDTLLYEGAVAAINETVGGSSVVVGIRPTPGIMNNTTGLEGKWLGEVVRAATMLNLDDANDIVNEIIPKYEEKLKSPPKGKPFQECFDTKTLQPSKEWRGIYRKVKNELIELGLPLDA
jgi:methylamine--corrinoid protein Co-methyltransferase